MPNMSNLLVGGAIALVALALLLGLGNLARGGDPALSQKLMRWRVGLQLLAIVLILAILFFRH